MTKKYISLEHTIRNVHNNIDENKVVGEVLKKVLPTIGRAKGAGGAIGRAGGHVIAGAAKEALSNALNAAALSPTTSHPGGSSPYSLGAEPPPTSVSSTTQKSPPTRKRVFKEAVGLGNAEYKGTQGKSFNKPVSIQPPGDPHHIENTSKITAGQRRITKERVSLSLHGKVAEETETDRKKIKYVARPDSENPKKNKELGRQAEYKTKIIDENQIKTIFLTCLKEFNNNLHDANWNKPVKKVTPKDNKKNPLVDMNPKLKHDVQEASIGQNIRDFARGYKSSSSNVSPEEREQMSAAAIDVAKKRMPKTLKDRLNRPEIQQTLKDLPKKAKEAQEIENKQIERASGTTAGQAGKYAHLATTGIGMTKGLLGLIPYIAKRGSIPPVSLTPTPTTSNVPVTKPPVSLTPTSTTPNVPVTKPPVAPVTASTAAATTATGLAATQIPQPAEPPTEPPKAPEAPKGSSEKPIEPPKAPEAPKGSSEKPIEPPKTDKSIPPVTSSTPPASVSAPIPSSREKPSQRQIPATKPTPKPVQTPFREKTWQEKALFGDSPGGMPNTEDGGKKRRKVSESLMIDSFYRFTKK